MPRTNLRWRWTGALFSLLLVVLPLQPAMADEGDPPARVARLSLIQGKLSFQPAGESEWSEISVNRAVSTGDRLYTDQQSRAELEVGPFAVRLSETTDLTVANLNDQLLQLGLGQGTIRVTVYDLPPNNTVEIDTPNGALTLQRPGSYRVDTNADGSSTQVTVTTGRLEVTGGDLRQDVDAGQSVQLTGAGPIQASLVSTPGPDDFDRWCAERDRRIEQYRSARYVSREVPGCEELDQYGVWREEPQYGPVWIPANVPPGWVPYRLGHWAWIEPWGWTWVDDEPWGFVPFHYGRWAYIGPTWCWVPGPVVVRPVYAPALVAFVGGFGVGVGVQAWFPLGPREPYVPWYHYGPTYFHQVNVTNVRNVTNITNITNVTNITNIHYVNKEVATTAVSGEAFRAGRPVRQGLVRVNPRELADARVEPHPEVTATRTAVYGGRNVAPPPVRTARVTGPGPVPRGQPSVAQDYPKLPSSGSHTSPPVTGHAGGVSPQVTRSPHAAPAPGGHPGGPPSTPPHTFITRNPPPQHNVPFTAREPALTSHPGRPLEPQQMQNLKRGQAAGPMRDKEVIPHAGKANHGPPPKAAPKEERGREKR